MFKKVIIEKYSSISHYIKKMLLITFSLEKFTNNFFKKNSILMERSKLHWTNWKKTKNVSRKIAYTRLTLLENIIMN